MLEAGLAAAAFRLLAARGTFSRRDLELRTPRSRLAFFVTGVAGNTVLCAFLGTLLARGFGAPNG